eukprot:UN01699
MHLQSHHINGSIINTDCGFTFVRNPIERLISGYYTNNVFVWRKTGDFESQVINKKIGKWTYIGVKGEPQRFRTFVNNLIQNPSNADIHVVSQSSHLSKYLKNQIYISLGKLKYLMNIFKN